MRGALLFFVVCAALSGCSESDGAAAAEGEVVSPPFEVRGDADGLLLVWFDAEGPHVASSRSEIPEAHRAFVRVDDLSLGPDQGAGEGMVYVANLSRAEAGADYTVRRMPRDAFETRVEEASGPSEDDAVAVAGDPNADVIIYGASWCSACRSTAAFLRENDIAFVERDIEREPGAREAMQQAAQAAGVRTTGIPVIDFRGEIIAGFNRTALRRAMARSGNPI